jgi:predicted transcriptional regulator
MAEVAESSKLVDGIVRLRRAERIPGVAREVAPVRRDLESRLGATLSRSRAAHILGVSQTALDRWVAARQIPIVMTPRGRREVPRQFVIELREAIDELIREGQHRHLLAKALERRRGAAATIGGADGDRGRGRSTAPEGHRTAERRALAYHELIAERLDEGMVEEAGERVERLVSEGHLHPNYAKSWQALLARPLADVAWAIVADTQEGRDLRQNSPFAGVLNEQERRRVIETTR